MKKHLSIFTLLTFIAFIIVAPVGLVYADDEVVNEKLGVPIVVYGDTLTAAQKEEVRDLLNAENLKHVEEYSVSGADIAKYIDGDPNSRMFSSAKIVREEKGNGIDINIVTPDNITQVTSEMYMNALLTAGVEDATVDVASPVKVTGHSALTGIYKAYDVAGDELDKDRMELANEELDLATELAEEENMSSEKVTELLTEIKKEIADKKPATKEDVERIVKEQLERLEITLSDKDFNRLVDLFEKMRDLNIDFSKVKSQLGDLTKKVKDKLEDLGIDEGFIQKIIDFFKSIIQAIVEFFRSLFS